MRLSKLLLGASLIAVAMQAQAQTVAPNPPVAVAPTRAPTTTLREAMVQAYNTNPGIVGDRANLRATDENVPIARAAGRPGVSGSAGYDENLYNTAGRGNGAIRQLTIGAQLQVPVYSGGAVRNSIRAAETRVLAGRSSLRGSESQLFLEVTTAYLDVIRDEAVVRLNRQNVRTLEVNLQATRDRFEVGDLTRTDVAQSEARLALAQGQLRGAEARLVGSRENYIRVVGSAPGDLAPPPALPNLPASAQQAVNVALEENPDLDAAEQQRDASRIDVDVARAQRLPQVSVGVGPSYYNNLGSVANPAFAANDGLSATAGVNLSLPIFQGGAPAARVRQAQAREAASIETVTLAERGVIAQARSAYALYQSALRVIESSRVAVEANRLSLEGVRAENSVGTRTILDILNAEQELVNAQVQYVTAERDAYVAGFQLLAVMGRAEASDLGLEGGPLYDPVANYDRVRNRWSDWGDDQAPQPVGTRTVDTPAQTPEVNESLDPILQRPVDTMGRNPSGGARN